MIFDQRQTHWHFKKKKYIYGTITLLFDLFKQIGVMRSFLQVSEGTTTFKPALYAHHQPL